MFLSKKHLDRRTFLRGMGATVALPLLDAMVPARTALASTAARPAPRLAFVYFPHGAVMREWSARILAPLAPFAGRLSIVDGLENRNAYGPVHAITPGTWLSAKVPHTGGETAGDMTADQIAAVLLGRDTLVPSIQVATEQAREICAGAWEGRYSGCYGKTISLGARGVPLPMDASPRSVFQKLFVLTRAEPEMSVLDMVAEDAAALRTSLGPADRRRLSEYLEGVRAVERRADTAAQGTCHEQLSLMFDMIALAFQADITRVATYMMAAETSQRTYGHIDVPDAFHALSHHQHDPDKIEKLARIQTYHSRVFAAFVEKLAGLDDGDGSLLDRSLILYGSNMSDSYAHDHYPLPTAVIGGPGRASGVRHVKCAERTPLANVLLTLLSRAGVRVASIGDSTGECAV